MLLITAAITFAAANITLFAPHPLDRDEWGLRVYKLSVPGPFLVGESIDSATFDVMLHNFSKKTRTYDPFTVALDVGDLNVVITKPDGKWLHSIAGQTQLRKSSTKRLELVSGKSATHQFRFRDFGYTELRSAGRYRLDSTFKIDGKKVTAPPVIIEVVEVSRDAILTTKQIPLEGDEATKPVDKQNVLFIQQVKVGERTLLIYRHNTSAESVGMFGFCVRLAELPGKCDMKVEGAFGDGNPLTISYKAAPYHKFTTTLVINSIDGRPWTAEEEKHRQDKLKKLAPVPEKK